VSSQKSKSIRKAERKVLIEKRRRAEAAARREQERIEERAKKMLPKPPVPIRLVNRTGQDVVLMTEDGTLVTIPAEEKRLWLEDGDVVEAHAMGVPIRHHVRYLKGVFSAPGPKWPVYYIVTREVAEFAPERNDFLYVDGMGLRSVMGVVPRGMADLANYIFADAWVVPSVRRRLQGQKA